VGWPRDLGRRFTAVGVTIALSSSEAFLVACRTDAPRSADEHDGGAPAAISAAASSSSGEGEHEADGSRSVPRTERREGEPRSDAGVLDHACSGTALSLLAAAVDPRCELSGREWSELVAVGSGAAEATPASTNTTAPGRGKGTRADRSPGTGTTGSLRQEARREGDRIVVSLVNRGSRPLVVPLRYHPGHPELAFTVLAEIEGRGVFELEAPTNDAPAEPPSRPAKSSTSGANAPQRPNVLAELDAGPTFRRVHTARIRLLPGGTARATLHIDPRIVKRLDRTCADAGARPRAPEDAADECLPARLPKGHVVLYVGQLVTAIDAGEPARVEWDAP